MHLCCHTILATLLRNTLTYFLYSFHSSYHNLGNHFSMCCESRKILKYYKACNHFNGVGEGERAVLTKILFFSPFKIEPMLRSSAINFLKSECVCPRSTWLFFFLRFPPGCFYFIRAIPAWHTSESKSCSIFQVSRPQQWHSKLHKEVPPVWSYLVNSRCNGWCHVLNCLLHFHVTSM